MNGALLALGAMAGLAGASLARRGSSARTGLYDPNLIAALHDWTGSSASMMIHMRDAREGVPVPPSKSGADKRAQAEALLHAIEQAARPCPHPLYRGDHEAPHGLQPWTTRRAVAERWAKKNPNGWVHTLPAGTRGLKISHFIHDLFQEHEWIVETPEGSPARTPDYIEAPSDLFRESGMNITEVETVARYGVSMTHGWGHFPPISGQMTVVDDDDLKAYRKAKKAGHTHKLAWSRPLTRNDLWREVVVIEDGHHRAHAAAWNGIPIRVKPFHAFDGIAWSSAEIRNWWAHR